MLYGDMAVRLLSLCAVNPACLCFCADSGASCFCIGQSEGTRYVCLYGGVRYINTSWHLSLALSLRVMLSEPVALSLSEPQFYRLEGVWLTETGMSLLRSISVSPLQKRRPRRSRLGTSDGLEFKEGDPEGEEGKGEALPLSLPTLPPAPPAFEGSALSSVGRSQVVQAPSESGTPLF